MILTNGDRHWQYHSIDPETGLHEFGCGPARDIHAVSPSEGRDPRYHQYLRIRGGFLLLRLDPGDAENNLVIEHRDVTISDAIIPASRFDHSEIPQYLHSTAERAGRTPYLQFAG